MSEGASFDVIVIGAGVVGLSTAFSLAEVGKRVLIFDRKGMALEASFGNAGALAFSDILPLASPRIMRQALKWLVDPLGPLSVPPLYFPRIAPWLLRFWRASWRDRYEASILAQVALMELARDESEALIGRAGLSHAIRSDGVLHLYENEAQRAAAQPGWLVRERHGIAFEPVAGARLAELQPGLSQQFVAGCFVPGWKTVSDPHEVAVGIGKAALERGAMLRIVEVAGVERAGVRARVVLSDGETLEASHVVIAAGAWSHHISRQLGDVIPLETERGYNTTLPPGAFDIRRQLVFDAHGFVVTPLSTGLRIGGAVELGGLKAGPNFRRSSIMLEKTKHFLPGLKTEGGLQWMGFRPSLPDSLPVIGPSTRSPRILYAFGHGHLGLTQSAATARLVRDLVLGQPAAIDLAPFRADRFRTWM
ncbi:MAG: FAD-binding oxidoreductase [Beijerinckiaceae bacterium]|nr:FAD-binding oxidoreductase [Beijerinckiaceae bacterium]